MGRGREKFYRFRIVLNIITKFFKIFPYGFRVFLFHRMRMMQGIVAMGLRYCLLKSISKSIGENVSIHPGVYIFNMKELVIGNNVSIHPMTYIEALGGIVIGNDVSIAHNVTIMSVNHKYSDLNIPIKDQGLVLRPINIQDNVWIGAKATVLYGVTISKGTVVAAGALVNRNTEENWVVGKVPAQMLKNRG